MARVSDGALVIGTRPITCASSVRLWEPCSSSLGIMGGKGGQAHSSIPTHAFVILLTATLIDKMFPPHSSP